MTHTTSTVQDLAPHQSGMRKVRLDGTREQAYRKSERGLWQSLEATPTERYVELPRLAVRVRVQEVGEGPAAVYLHGGPSAGATWAPLAAQLDGIRSIIVDRPGTGLSEAFPVAAANLDSFADHFLVDLLDALGLDRAHIVASSFGGFLGLRAAAIAPERIDRMVQMSCPAGVSGMTVPTFMRAAAVPVLRWLMAAMPVSERGARSMLSGIGHAASVEAGLFTPEFMTWYLSLQRDTATMRNELRMIGSFFTVRGIVHPALSLSDALLRSVRTPTFFYWGADDPFGAEDVAEQTVAALGDATLRMVPRAGHLPWLDDPADAARAVESFLLEGAPPMRIGAAQAPRKRRAVRSSV